MKIKHFIFALLFSFILCSCETSSYVTTQDDIYVENEVNIVSSDIDFNVVVQFGTPYYYNGRVIYYFYNDLYYYPYYYNNYWYVRTYTKPFRTLHHRPYFRPHKYDHRFLRRNGIYERPRYYNRTYNKPFNRSRINDKPNHNVHGNSRPNVHSRPNNVRPSNGQHGHSGRLGGRR